MKKKQDTTIESIYPTETEVKTATNWQIRHWYNTLGSPVGDEQIIVMKLIIERNRKLKQATQV